MPPKSSKLVALGLLLSLGAFIAVHATDVTVNLTGEEETPPTASKATGTGTITVRDDKTVTGTIRTTGIDSTVAHIHLGSAGKSGPPIINLTKMADNVWTVPDKTKLTDDQYKSFVAGDLYVNVHSAANPSGEIRAQLKP
jgi:CHRD domain